MRNRLASTQPSRRAANLVRQRVERGGERLWRFEDFRDLPWSAVAQALSRLTRTGSIERLSKGVYYRSRQTAFGKEPTQSCRDRQAGVKTEDRLPGRNFRRQSPRIHDTKSRAKRNRDQRRQPPSQAHRLRNHHSYPTTGGMGRPLR